MKLIVTSDLHIEKDNDQSCNNLPTILSRFIGTNPNEKYIFAIVGDVSQDIQKLESYLALFSSLSIPKLYVAGNHDIWSQKVVGKTTSENINSLELYQNFLPKICKRTGFHYLDQSPYIVNRIGFIGNIGWYDFSFHTKIEPPASKKLTFIRRDTNQQFSWSDISFKDLANKELWAMDVHQTPIRISAWNDLYYIKWPSKIDDADFCKICYKTINQHFEDTYNSIDHLIFMSHHALFEECIVRYSSYQAEFNNAFRGCRFLGDFVISHPKLRKTIFGHTHEAGVYHIERDIEAINPLYTPKVPFRVISLNF